MLLKSFYALYIKCVFRILNVNFSYIDNKFIIEALKSLPMCWPLEGFKSLYNKLLVYVTEIV